MVSVMNHIFNEFEGAFFQILRRSHCPIAAHTDTPLAHTNSPTTMATLVGKRIVLPKRVCEEVLGTSQCVLSLSDFVI